MEYTTNGILILSQIARLLGKAKLRRAESADRAGVAPVPTELLSACGTPNRGTGDEVGAGEV